MQISWPLTNLELKGFATIVRGIEFLPIGCQRSRIVHGQFLTFARISRPIPFSQDCLCHSHVAASKWIFGKERILRWYVVGMKSGIMPTYRTEDPACPSREWTRGEFRRFPNGGRASQNLRPSDPKRSSESRFVLFFLRERQQRMLFFWQTPKLEGYY